MKTMFFCGIYLALSIIFFPGIISTPRFPHCGTSNTGPAKKATEECCVKRQKFYIAGPWNCKVDDENRLHFFDNEKKFTHCCEEAGFTFHINE